MERSFSVFRSIQIGVLLAVMYYAFIFDDGTGLKAETQKVKNTIVVKKKELNKIIKEERELREYAKLFDSLGEQVAGKILHILNAYSVENNFAVFLSNEAKQLDLFNVSVSRVRAFREKKWEVQEVRVSLEGGYHQIMQFITSIQNAQKLIIMQLAEINPSNSGSRLRASLTVRLYQFSKKEEFTQKAGQ